MRNVGIGPALLFAAIVAMIWVAALQAHAAATDEKNERELPNPFGSTINAASLLAPQPALPLPNYVNERSALPPQAAEAAEAAEAMKQPDDPPVQASPATGAGAVPADEGEAPAKPDGRIERYTVTAYYLNVRERGDNKARIRAVVERGATLEVTGRTDGGWLALAGGGYVHGSYAKPDKEPAAAQPAAEADGKRDQPVRTLSAVRLPPGPALKPPAEPLTDVQPLRPVSKVISDSGLTKAHIARMLKGTELSGEGLEEAVLGIEDEYGINAYFTIAVMKLESGNGKSRLARSKNNLFGLNATGGLNQQAYSFETKGDSVWRFGKLIAKSYVGKGYITIEQVAEKYCPANGKWPNLVSGIMKSDYRKL